jgi:GDP-4-dehydro-6-deoxy-D-mannose reductase
MKVLVTGLGGFVGRWLLPALTDCGHVVSGTRLPSDPDPLLSGVMAWRPMELGDEATVRGALDPCPDAVIHLAAVASGAEARQDPSRAFEVNAAGTGRLASELGRHRDRGTGDPLLLLVSTAEIYGVGMGSALRRETEPPQPISPYAASKLAAEAAALDVARRTGLRVIIARPFPHTGPGQTDRYVIPAFAQRLRAARRTGETRVPTGNLDPVRDYLDVRDVVAAYTGLLEQGHAGAIYNVASGVGWSLGEVFHRLARLIGVAADPVLDPALQRSEDLMHLVGDATRLRTLTGWTPRIPFDQTLQDVVNAQTD